MFAMVFLSGNYLRSLVWIIFLSGVTKFTYASLADVVKQTEELNFGYNSSVVENESGDEDTDQPQIEPYYFWSFLTIVNGKIPGHFPFNVLGHVEVVDGGLYFDGITAFLSNQLVPNNILANPETAKEGLAFGVKMKFDGTSKEYDIPRYVLDTGATSGGNTGVSLYILNGKLIAEIATPAAKWKAEITLIYDQWFYIIVNWKSTFGLVIAFNGFPKSSDRKGSAVTGLQPSTKNPNFCLGRNVGGTGFYYTKFYLASLVVFKEYLSDSLIYSVYSYYRINAFKAAAVSTEENEEAVAVEALPVAARHSWIFTFILNGIIPGDVYLSVHGKTVAKEGATIFDGVTSWLGATLHFTDCLLAPANCRDGLSIGFKIRFTGLVNFLEERYIVDTGVLSKGTRGIAIYLQDGQLFCVVMTMSAQWKLGMIVPRDRWIFIGISWSENQGLYLYNGGELISQTKIKTPQNQVPISNASPNFVFGRSLAGTGFARFDLASFSTFTTFLGPSAMRPVFTYYWRID